jgi:hypothetical protein
VDDPSARVAPVAQRALRERVPRNPAFLPALGAILLLAAVSAVARDIAAPAHKWTATDPPINLRHIDFGEINRYGEAVGYHHRPGGVDPEGARVVTIVQPPDANGVYRALVAIRDRMSGAWVAKKTPSTFFPDALSDAEIVEAILAAFHDGRIRHDGHFLGASGRGFMIEGWYQNGRITAAYPLRGP